MKILFISDVTSWKKYAAIFDHVKPDLVMMGGDLISDGLASFWDECEKLIITLPKLRTKLLKFLEDHKSILKPRKPNAYEKVIDCIKNGYTGEIRTISGFASTPLVYADLLFKIDEHLHFEFHKLCDSLEEKARKSKEFLDIIESRISRFYEALQYSGKKCRAVFVVMGDHDFYDVPESYSLSRISSINNVHEISGRSITFEELRILGLGYMETHYLRRLRPLISSYQGKIDLLLTHAEQRRMTLLACLRPQLILRGHYMRGIYQVDGVRVASALFPAYVEVEVRDSKISHVEYIESEREDI